MSLSLRDQLLQAGLITKKQAQAATQNPRPAKHVPKQEQAKRAPSATEVARQAAEAARVAKLAQDQARSRAAQEKAEAQARRAQVKQLVDQHKLPKVDSEDCYHFVDGTKIRRLPVTAALRAQLVAGTLDVVKCDGRYELVAAAIAERIRERDPRAVLPRPAADQKPAEDDPYKDFVVPDDLVW